MTMFRVNKNLCVFSPLGKYIASALQQELIVRDSRTLESCQLYVFADTIEYIEWSFNGQYILCANSKNSIAQIFSLKYPDWKCKLIEGSAGFERISWAPDSKSILITSDLNIHVSVWRLDGQNITHIWNLKSSVRNIALNECGQRLGVIVSKDGIDSVEIYETENWKLTRKLMCNKLFGIDGVSWSPNGELLALWCSTIGKSRLLIYSTVIDAHIGAYSSEKIADNPAESIKGIQKVIWSPSGQFLAVAGYNETVAIINHVTWSIVLNLYCGPVIKEGNYLGRVFKEVNMNKGDWSNYISTSSIPEHHHRYIMDEINERPINITIDVKSNNWDISIATIDIIQFSPCGKFVAVRHQLYPSTLWIWDLLEDSIDYILLKNPISGVVWAPTKSRLLVFSESSVIVEWRRSRKAACFESPRGMKVLKATWHVNGEILALYGYNKTWMIHLKD